MSDPVRIFATLVLLASAAYIVTTNLQFRRQWPATVERSRRRLLSSFANSDRNDPQRVYLQTALAALETDRNLMLGVAAMTGGFAGGLAGVLLDAALVAISGVASNHSFALGFAGALFGAIAFAVLAIEQ